MPLWNFVQWKRRLWRLWSVCITAFPDLAPCSFWLLPKVNVTMKGNPVESTQDTEAATRAQLKTLMKELLELHQKVARTVGYMCLKAEVWGGPMGSVSFAGTSFYRCKHCIFWWHLVLFLRRTMRHIIIAFLALPSNRRREAQSHICASTLTPGLELLCKFWCGSSS